VGTCILDTYAPVCGTDARAQQVEETIRSIVVEGARWYPGRRIDIICLPEDVLSSKTRSSAAEAALPMDSPLIDRFRSIARQQRVHLVLPVLLREATGCIRNAALLFDREGNHLVLQRYLGR